MAEMKSRQEPFWVLVQMLERWLDETYPEDIFECFGYELAEEAEDIVNPGAKFVSRVRTAIRDLKREADKEFDGDAPSANPSCLCAVIPD